LQPNEERLLSYAIDLGMEVEPGFESEPGKLTAVKIVKGIAYTTHKLREHRTWNIKNRTDQERTLVLEHPYRPEYQLVTPKEASERSRDVYRFDVKVPAGQTVKHEVVEERNLEQSVHLTNQDDESIKILLTSNVTSPKVKAALEKAQSLRNQVAGTQRDLAQVNEDLKQISEDQSRLRANLREMPPTAAAYKRYLEKFDRQESEIEKLQARLKELQVAVNQQQAAFEQYLAGLEVE
jgi:predicted RNase H-like nuclease (RuvC/YqgF family)